MDISSVPPEVLPLPPDPASFPDGESEVQPVRLRAGALSGPNPTRSAGSCQGKGEGCEAEEEVDDGKRKVKFRDGDLVTEFVDQNLWAHDPNETAHDMIEAYKRECASSKVRPITKLLEQLERLDELSTPIDTLDLKGVRLDSRSCELLEVVLSRMQMTTLDLERASLEDEGAIALCEMIEFYGCASRLILSNNNRLRPRAWLSIGRTLKKSPFIDMVNVSYCALEEQTLTLLLRSVRANCALQVLKMEGNNLAGKGTFILMAAMKFNENLQELWLGSNHLGPEDGQHLGSILRTNHTLRVLDLRDNNLQDGGVRYISAGVAEQQEGLHVLNLTANSLTQEGSHHVSAMLPCTRSLRELNLSHNRCGDNGLFMLKLGLLANRSLEKLNLSNFKMTCEGAIALAEVLAESKHLVHLDLKDNDIRVAGLLALQLAHRMNRSLLFMETPKAYRVEQRDRQLIRDLLAEIDRYCARNLHEREERAEAERRRQHEAQHAQLVGSGEETSQFTAGESTKEEEEEKEVDPSLVGSLDDVYTDEPGSMMTDDPFQRMPVLDDKEKPASLMAMEKSLDALVYTGEEDLDSSDLDASSLDRGVRTRSLGVQSPESSEEDTLPDVVGALSGEQYGHENPDLPRALPDVQPTTVSHTPRPDVASSSPSAPSLPLDLAVGAQQAVDLVDQASQALGGEPISSQPMDLTDGLLQLSISAHT